MPTQYKILGQVNPAANTYTPIYTVPAAKSALCSTLSVCNLGAATTFRVVVRAGGAALEAKHYIVHDTVVAGDESVFLSIGLTLGVSDVVEVYAGSASLAFSLFGSEIS